MRRLGFVGALTVLGDEFDGAFGGDPYGTLKFVHRADLPPAAILAEDPVAFRERIMAEVRTAAFEAAKTMKEQ